MLYSNMEKFKYILSIIFVLFTSCSLKSTQDTYDLNLKFNEGKWRINLDNTETFEIKNIGIDHDTITPFIISNRDKKNLQKNNNFKMFQRIPLNEAKMIKIQFKYKTNTDNDICFDLKCIDRFEKIVTQLNYNLSNSNNKWKNAEFNTSCQSANIISIEVKGNLSKPGQSLCLSDLKIFGDGMDINSISSINNSTHNNSKSIVNIKNFSSLSNIYNDLANKSIIGLGENVHGSKSIDRIRLNLTRQLINKGECKLVLIELDYFKVALWNEFIQGNSNIKIDDEIKNARSLYSVKEMTDFIIWLKSYNDNAKEKVTIVGMDISNINDRPQGYYNYFLKNCSKELSDTINYRLFVDIYKSDESFYNYINNNEKILKELGAEKHSNLLYNIKNDVSNDKIINKNGSAILYPYYRDSIMFNNMEYYMNKYLHKNKKVILLAHIGHLNKSCNLTHNSNSMGYYINQKWKDNYYVISFSALGGYYTNNKNNNLTSNLKLKNCRDNSLESMYCQSDYENAYFKLPSIKNSTYFRIIGNRDISENYQYFIINPNAFMDAIITIKNSEGIEVYPKEYFDSIDSRYDNVFKENLLLNIKNKQNSNR